MDDRQSLGLDVEVLEEDERVGLSGFFATLETELIDRSDWASPAESKAAVCEYIEVFYNRIRRHSSLNDLSPEQFEARYRSAPPAKAV